MFGSAGGLEIAGRTESGKPHNIAKLYPKTLVMSTIKTASWH
jgi:hypothetical protein